MKNNQLRPLFIIFFIIMTAECVQGLGKQFHYITHGKNWANARQHCRTHYTDLATVRSQKESEQLQSILPSVSSHVIYLGLYRDPDNVTAWRWTEGPDDPVTSSEYTNWFDPFQPQPRNCTCISFNTITSHYKKWWSLPCLEIHYTLCSNSDGTFELVKGKKTWEEAQQYCKENHQSLATITDPNSLTYTDYSCVWIGLIRGVDAEWKWVGETQSDHRNWFQSHPNNRDCGIIRYDNYASTYKWQSDGCERNLYFVCHNEALMLVRQKKTWEEALEFCRALGGEHAVSHSYDLASLVSDDVHLYAKEKILAATTDQVWTGLRFLAGRWLWVSGEQLQYQDLPVCPATGWRCGSMPTDGTQRQEVRDCTEKKNFLCMKTT